MPVFMSWKSIVYVIPGRSVNTTEIKMKMETSKGGGWGAKGGGWGGGPPFDIQGRDWKHGSSSPPPVEFFF